MDDVQLTPRERTILEQLKSVWQLPREISTETLTQITETVLHLPDPQKLIGLQKIAEYAMSVMNIHILSLLSLFQRNAGTEGISEPEQRETLEQVAPDLFHMLDQPGTNHLHVASLDDLATFHNVALSIRLLSQSESADEAQNWLYELPITYPQQLHQEHLLIEQTETVLTPLYSEPLTEQSKPCFL